MSKWNYCKGVILIIIFVLSIFVTSCKEGDQENQEAADSPLLTQEEMNQAADQALVASGWTETPTSVDVSNQASVAQSAQAASDVLEKELQPRIMNEGPKSSVSNFNNPFQRVITSQLQRSMDTALVQREEANSNAMSIDVTTDCQPGDPNGGTVKLSGDTSINTVVTDGYNYNYTGIGTVDFQFDSCRLFVDDMKENSVTIFGSGKIRMKWTEGSSSSAVVKNSIDEELPKSVVMTRSLGHGIYTGVVMRDATQNVFKLTYFSELNFTETATEDYSAFQDSTTDTKLSFVPAEDVAASAVIKLGINGFVCTGSVTGDPKTVFTTAEGSEWLKCGLK